MKHRNYLKIVIDLDGTLLQEKRARERPEAQPLPGAIEAVNALYEMGHIIIIYTARTDVEQELTVRQLEEFGIKYHQLIVGKPVGDIFIDDRALAFTDWATNWDALLDKIREKMKEPIWDKNEA